MSITLVQPTPSILPSFNRILYRITSTNANETGFKYVVKVYNSANELIATAYYDSPANPADEVEFDVSKLANHYVKVIVVNKKDLYQFDQFIDRVLRTDCHEVKIIEDFSDLDANTVSDDIVENTEDTMTLLSKYIEELDTSLDKGRLISLQRQLYTEAQDLEI